jgi:hypothetical protein
MVIFNSYVKLPEGIVWVKSPKEIGYWPFHLPPSGNPTWLKNPSLIFPARNLHG